LNNESLYIGKDEPGANEYFCGTMDDLKIYNGALTDIDIQKEYQQAPKYNNQEDFVFECPQNINIKTDEGKCGAIVNYNLPLIDPKCSGASIKQLEGEKSGDFFELGSHQLVFEATSNTGYVKTCYSKIEIKDFEKPLIRMKPDTLIKIKDISIKPIFNYDTPYVSDNCLVKNIVQIKGLKSGVEYPFERTLNEFEVTDFAGNKAIGRQNVTFILDTAKIIPDEKEHMLTDTVKVAHNLKFKNEYLTLVMYDDSQQDNDTVSIFYNGLEIVYKSLITTKNNGSIVRVIKLNPNQKNEFVVKAWNTGKYSPNTLRIDFYEGDYSTTPQTLLYKKPSNVKIAHSLPGLACGITINLKP
jgi:hypothetical protein